MCWHTTVTNAGRGKLASSGSQAECGCDKCSNDDHYCSEPQQEKGRWQEFITSEKVLWTRIYFICTSFSMHKEGGSFKPRSHTSCTRERKRWKKELTGLNPLICNFLYVQDMDFALLWDGALNYIASSALLPHFRKPGRNACPCIHLTSPFPCLSGKPSYFQLCYTHAQPHSGCGTNV